MRTSFFDQDEEGGGGGASKTAMGRMVEKSDFNE